MMTSSPFRNLAFASALTFTVLGLHAQSTPANDANTSAVPASTQQAETPHNWNTEQICTCTIRECWALAGKNETTFFDIVAQLAEMSAQKRGLTLPNDAEAGRKAGEYIKARAKADPDELLYAVVDEGVRKVGK